jgi:glucose-6-phosphate-specific signal transduction histidine kinase
MHLVHPARGRRTRPKPLDRHLQLGDFSNVVRHAEATKVEIDLLADGILTLEVRDNGKGISMSRSPTRHPSLMGSEYFLGAA